MTPSLEVALDRFAAARAAEGLAPATRATELHQLRSALQAIARDADCSLADASCALLAPETLRAHLASFRAGTDGRFADAAEAPPHAPSSVRARLQALRSFCHWAASEGHLTEDPAAALRLRTPQPVRTRACTRSEIDDLLAAAALGRAPERDRVLLLLPLTLGATLSEITALALDDLDLAAATCTLERAGAARTLSLPPSLQRAVEAWLPVRTARLTRLGRTPSSSVPLLLTALSPTQPLCSSPSLGRAIHRCFQRAGVGAGNLGIQRLRASFATLALEAGASPRDLQDALAVELPALRQLTHRARPQRLALPPHPLGEL